MPTNTTLFSRSALRTIKMEARAVEALVNIINDDFDAACQCLLQCQGKVVVMGMGKSGHIARKIAATLASTGTPAFFIHPAEASHGDMGMIQKGDVALTISNSGKTSEILTLLPLFIRLHVPVVSISGDEESPLAKSSTHSLVIDLKEEACPLNLAPTSSTTSTLVLGDAMAIALLEAKGFTANDFAFSHPGGALGRRLLLKVTDIMFKQSGLPLIEKSAPLEQALLLMTQKGLGLALVVDSNGVLMGIFTDGDLRRALDRRTPNPTGLPKNTNNTINNASILDIPIEKVMNCKPKIITADNLAVKAVDVMEEHKINALVVVDEKRCPIGVITMHALLSAGVV